MASQLPGNRLQNPGAEDGLAGWLVDGVRVAGYGEDPARYPSPGYAAQRAIGVRLFAAERNGATMAQVVDLSDLAEKTDGGRQEISAGGSFGGAGLRPDAVQMEVRYLDAARQPIGAPWVFGGPTVKDRDGETEQLSCGGWLGYLPPGARAVEVVLRAINSAVAPSSASVDSLYVLPYAIGTPGIVGTYGMAEAPFCQRNRLPRSGQQPPPQPGAPQPPARAPRPASVAGAAVLWPRQTCRRAGALRFALRPQWVNRVRSLTVTVAGGRSVRLTARPGRRAVTIARPRSNARIKVKVALHDGTTDTRSLRYKACPRRR